MIREAYLGLGSNIGKRHEFLEGALAELDKIGQITIESSSSIYETDPVGYEEQDLFLNMVVRLRTSLSPHQLLQTCLNIEKELGRTREIHWGPRTIDIDLLLYEDEIINTDTLVLPHPRLHERNFVVIPLLELAPEIKLASMDLPLATYVEEIGGFQGQGVRLWQREGSGEIE